MSTVAITPDLIAQHQLTESEYRKIVDILGREPNYTELGVFSVMWSEHCSYKSSRLHLKKLPTRGKLVVQGPGENAGIIDVGGGYVIAFKIESHNHPSFIEPFQGAATGVGGILRDIFTMGARPIAVLDSLRFGPLDDPQERPAQPPHPAGRGGGHRALRQLLRRAHGGRRMHFRGLLQRESAGERLRAGRGEEGRHFLRQRRRRRQPGDLRGRQDRPRRHPRRVHGVGRVHRGIQTEAAQRAGGRSVSGKAAAGGVPGSHADRRDRGIQDMGAAGLTCSTCEMGSRGGTGIEIELDLVPQRETGMTPYEIMLSESQERMLLVAAKGREDEVFRGFPQVGLGCRDHRRGHGRWVAARETTRRYRRRDPQSGTCG
jgi:phosphoribosylformylglycinamidine synthase subunit PurL